MTSLVASTTVVQQQVVIVTAYFQMKSKLPHETYTKYARNFFTNVYFSKISVVFFTSETVREEWKDFLTFPNIKIVIVPDDAIHTVFVAYKKWKREFWAKHIDLDLEKEHSVELGMIWYEKPHFILQAAAMFPEFQFYIWVDVGCVRNACEATCIQFFGHRFLKQHLLDEETKKQDKLHLQCINEIEYKNFYQFQDRSIAGAIMFGSKKAWMKHVELYDAILMEYDVANKCATKDQHIIRSCVDRRPDLYQLHTPPEPLFVDIWFFFLQSL